MKKYCTANVLMQTASHPGPFPQIHVVARIAAGNRNHDGFPKGSCRLSELNNAAITKAIASEYRNGAFRFRNVACHVVTKISKKHYTRLNSSSDSFARCCAEKEIARSP